MQKSGAVDGGKVGRFTYRVFDSFPSLHQIQRESLAGSYKTEFYSLSPTALSNSSFRCRCRCRRR